MMTFLRRAMGAIPLCAALLLAGCGGAGNGAAMIDRQSTPGIAVGEPPPAAKVVASADFLAKVQGANCAATRNRLFVIDQKMVFSDIADLGCADASWSRVLYGATPREVLCSSADSIAGPRTSCVDDASRALFDIILKNLDQPDLGLGREHKVETLAVLPPSGNSLSFDPVVSDAFSGVKVAKNVVVRDAAAWATLWAEHSARRTPAPELPKVDFGHRMLVAVFSGEQLGCHHLGIARVGVSGGALVVEYADQDVTMSALCIGAVSSGMQVVAVERSDAAVEFVNVAAAAIPFTSVEQSTRSNIRTARTVVVRDAAGWTALWKEHKGDAAPAPAVDFNKAMVLGVFLGSQPSGCYSTAFKLVYRSGKKIVAVHGDTVPGMGVLCTMNITTPADLIVVDRSDATVEFASQSHFLR